MNRHLIIWVTIWGLIVLGYNFDRLSVLGFFFLLIIGNTLAHVFDPEKKPTAKAVPKTEAEDDTCEDVIRIRRRHIEMLRNSLMRHHNSRTADKEYQASAAAKETTEVLQALNALLAKKQRQIQSEHS